MKNIIDISKIIADAKADGKDMAEINEALKEAGSNLFLTEKKVGNALLDIGVGSPELVTVENGKLITAAGVPHQDFVYYNGETYQLADDGVTLVK